MKEESQKVLKNSALMTAFLAVTFTVLDRANNPHELYPGFDFLKTPEAIEALMEDMADLFGFLPENEVQGLDVEPK